MTPDIRRQNENLLDLRSPQKKQPARSKKKPSKSVLLLVGGCFVLLIIAGGALFMTHKKADLNSVEVIKEKVSKHFLLPGNEEPALATITDEGKVNTPFLKQAKNGDKILVYQQAKKVIIYRPSNDRIVDIGPVSIADGNQAQ